MTPGGIRRLFHALVLQGYTLPQVVKTDADFEEMVQVWADLFREYDDSLVPVMLDRFATSREAAFRGFPTPAALLNGVRPPFIDDSIAVWDLVLAAANASGGDRERFPVELARIARRRGMDVDTDLVLRCVNTAVTLGAAYGTRDDIDRQRVGKAFGAAWVQMKRAAS